MSSVELRNGGRRHVDRQFARSGADGEAPQPIPRVACVTLHHGRYLPPVLVVQDQRRSSSTRPFQPGQPCDVPARLVPGLLDPRSSVRHRLPNRGANPLDAACSRTSGGCPADRRALATGEQSVADPVLTGGVGSSHPSVPRSASPQPSSPSPSGPLSPPKPSWRMHVFWRRPRRTPES
jgi:hypothetical protein